MKTLTTRSVIFALSIAAASLSLGQELGSSVQSQGPQYATYTLPQGQIKVALTNDLTNGAQFTGTVIAVPKGKTEAEREKNEGVLKGYVVGTGTSKAKPGEHLKFIAPLVGTKVIFDLFDSKGKPAGTQQMPMLPNAPSTPPAFDLPEIVQPGKPFTIPGPCDGDISDLSVRIGGKSVPMLAESPWQGIGVCPPSLTPGAHRIEMVEANARAEGDLRVVSITLRAQETMTIGQSTPLQIFVQGLEGYDQQSILKIVNMTPQVVRLEAGEHGAAGGNAFVDMSPFGASETSRTIGSLALTALTPGGFEIECQLLKAGRCGATTHQMKIHGPSKTKKGSKHVVEWKEQCQLGTCYLNEGHAGDHAYAWKTCKDHKEVEHSEEYDSKDDRDAKYREVEKERDKRAAEHDF